MEDLPVELLPIIVPDPRSWVILSKTSRIMAGLMTSMIERRGTGEILRTRKNTLENRNHQVYVDGKFVTEYFSLSQVIEEYVIKDGAIMRILHEDVIPAVIIFNIPVKVCKVTIPPRKIACNHAELTDIACALSHNWQALIPIIGAGGKRVGETMVNNWNTIIRFDDGECLGLGLYTIKFIGGFVINSTIPGAELLKRLPQLGGDIYVLDEVFGE